MIYNLATLTALDAVKSNQVQQTLNNGQVEQWMAMGWMAVNHAAPAAGAQTTTTNTVGGLNPAQIFNPRPTYANLNIDVARWFFRSYDVGYQIGLFCHEVAAHFMTDENITMHGGWYRGNTAVAHTPANSEQQITAANTPITDTITGIVSTPGTAPQSDHIFAASNAYMRFQQYRISMHTFGLEMQAVAGALAGAAFGAAHYQSLVDCWLMDVASIVATADRRIRGVGTLANNVAAAYNAFRLHLQAVYPLPGHGAGPAPLIDAAIHAVPAKTAGQVRLAYLRMLGGLIWRYFW